MTIHAEPVRDVARSIITAREASIMVKRVKRVKKIKRVKSYFTNYWRTADGVEIIKLDITKEDMDITILNFNLYVSW